MKAKQSILLLYTARVKNPETRKIEQCYVVASSVLSAFALLKDEYQLKDDAAIRGVRAIKENPKIIMEKMNE